MLTRVVLIPNSCAPEGTPGVPDSARRAAILAALRDLRAFGCLAIDERAATLAAVKAALRRTFDNKSDEPETYLDDIAVSTAGPSGGTWHPQTPCDSPSCLPWLRLIRHLRPDCVIAAAGCRTCPALKEATDTGPDAVGVVDITSYQKSGTAKRHLLWAKQGFSPQNWEQDTLASDLLAPLFSVTSQVWLWDQWIARSFQESSSDPTGFIETLEWLYQQYERHGRQPKRALVVASGLRVQQFNGRGQRTIRSWADQGVVLAATADELAPTKELLARLQGIARSGKTKVKLELRVQYSGDRQDSRISDVPRRYPRTPELPHDRFLVTDHVRLAVGRGFDLTRPKSTMLKPTTINRTSGALADFSAPATRVGPKLLWWESINGFDELQP